MENNGFPMYLSLGNFLVLRCFKPGNILVLKVCLGKYIWFVARNLRFYLGEFWEYGCFPALFSPCKSMEPFSFTEATTSEIVCYFLLMPQTFLEVEGQPLTRNCLRSL